MTTRFVWIMLGLSAVALCAVVIVAVVVAGQDEFGHDTANVRPALFHDLPHGTPLPAVLAYVQSHFNDSQWFAQDRCLGARYTTFSNSRYGPPSSTGSVSVYFYFDAKDQLIRFDDHGALSPQPLKPPEQFKRELDAEIHAEMRRLGVTTAPTYPWVLSLPWTR